ncbi:DUF262 domain-containing protein [Spiroplasma endosymbiont of Cantharis rufa]|uniref:DUF262 domain-containing protein n=1 Tax=Spiroplasma endosymbiont of Cantharis rufa TaxID=3066279 RepID=UPI0030D1D333
MSRITEKNLINLLKEVKVFNIPEYQREYSWNEEKIELIMEPLLCETNNSMFSGNLILKIGDEKDIIDGQQRLVTYIIIILALYLKSDSETYLGEELKEIAEKIIDGNLIKFNKIKDSKSFERIKQYVSDNIKIKNNSEIPKKTLMEKSFLSIWKKIHKENIEEVINRLNQVFFSIFYVNTEDEAIETFVIMNTRGQQLKKWDVVKSKFILSSLERDDSFERWNKIESYLSYDISKKEYFLLFFLNSKLVENISQKEIIKKFHELIEENKDNLKKLEEDMIHYAEILSEIYNPTKNYWKEIYETVYDISNFTFKQLFPIIAIIKLSLNRKNNSELQQKNYINLLSDLLLYLIRTSTISNVYGTEPRKLIIKIKEDLFDSKNKFNYKEYSTFNFTSLIKINEIIKDKTYETSSDEKLAKWILRKFYIIKTKINKKDSYNKELLFNSFEKVSLEHIVDKNINRNYFDNMENNKFLLKEWYVEEKINTPKEIFSIGNFTILHRNENSMLGNKSWKKLYRKLDFFWGNTYDSLHLLKLEDENSGFKNCPKLIDKKTINLREKYIIDNVTKNNIFKFSFEE